METAAPDQSMRLKTDAIAEGPAAKGGLEQKLEHAPMGGSAAKLKEGMSVIDIVIFEHNAVKELYQQYQSAREGQVKEAKAQLIINQLVQHSGKEEIVLYPIMKSKLADGVAQVERAKAEHQLVTEDLYKLDKMTWAQSPAEYDRLVTKTMTDLLTHIQEEETILLPSLQAKCSQQELVDMGRQFQSATVTTRPHPWAPREGLSAAAAHAGSIPLDAMRDAARFTTQQKELAQH